MPRIVRDANDKGKLTQASGCTLGRKLIKTGLNLCITQFFLKLITGTASPLLGASPFSLVKTARELRLWQVVEIF
jgi:hypothetical protein